MRGMRLLKLFNEVQQYKIIMRTISSLIKPFSSLLLVSFILFTIFAIIGDRVFGGLSVNEPAVVKNQNIPDTYLEMNFNDNINSFVTLFTLMVVNNWFVIVDMFENVKGTIWVRLYFITFYFFSVLVVLNILVAFAIDMYSSIESVNSQKKQEQSGRTYSMSFHDCDRKSESFKNPSIIEQNLEKMMTEPFPQESQDYSDSESSEGTLSKLKYL